ncbi:MAG: hypothetical protein ACI4UM_08975 [Succinivibrio sp.]
MNTLLDSFQLLGDIFLPLGVIVLIAILCIITYALIRSSMYFIHRIPEDGNDKENYLSYKERAELYKARVEEYKKSIEDLQKQYLLELESLKNRVDEEKLKDSLETELETIANKIELANSELTSLSKENIKNSAEYEYLNSVLPKLEKEKNEINKHIDASKSEFQTISRDLEKVVADYQQKQSKISLLDRDIGKSKAELQQLVDQKEKLFSQISSYKKDNERYANVLKDFNNKQSEAQRLDRDIGRSRAELQHLVAMNSKLQEDIDRITQEQKAYHEGYKSLMEAPPSLQEYAKKAADSFDNEEKELDLFEHYLISKNYYFPRRTINAFHTSLKIQNYNPLTVLAGISGTGKTLLPTKYAEYFGIYNLVLPVEPRWDSPQDLLGFYNYLEKKFQATELSRALVAFDNRNKYEKEAPRLRSKDGARIASVLEDRMFIVLLDEMNLARTEYYFSNFLSKLELRRNVDDESSDSQRSNAEILIDDNFGKIWIPQNVLFVGTMNEDESTQTLSDKVLDRANLLRFGKPNQENLSSSNKNQVSGNRLLVHSAIPYSTYRTWINDPSKLDSTFVDNVIRDLNDAMALINKPFGFRVDKCIRAYVANYPNALKDEQAEKSALADQIEQKIMPKLRGLDLSESSSDKCVRNIQDIVNRLNDKEFDQAFAGAIEEGYRSGMFMWQGVSRL